LPFLGWTGESNAITDVAGVEVGFTTLIAGEGPLVVGEGPVRTGVTAILPRGQAAEPLPVWAGTSTLNGAGEMTGAHWIAEYGHFLGPLTITNTHSIGIAHHATARWMRSHYQAGSLDAYDWVMPVAAETFDGHLNDIDGFHVTEAHVIAAIDGAAPGLVAEGNVGGGTGMIAYEFKGGTGTASRMVALGGRPYVVGALVQANFGIRPWLTVLGVPVGRHLTTDSSRVTDQGSIIAVVATDAPLLPTQLQRVARRAALGVGRTGTVSGDSSGDIFLAFSTAGVVPRSGSGEGLGHLEFAPDPWLDPIFAATVEAVEEAILNALVAATTMVGRDSQVVPAIDHNKLRDVMARYNRLKL
jgi:D-aminopeptidase